MVEPTDAILPILQRTQADIVALTRTVEAQGGVLAEHGRKLDAIEGYLTYQPGITTRTIADGEALKRDIIDIKKRVDLLERQ